jgi:hypothetical protein
MQEFAAGHHLPHVLSSQKLQDQQQAAVYSQVKVTHGTGGTNWVVVGSSS